MHLDPSAELETIREAAIPIQELTLSEVAKLPTSHGQFNVRVIRDANGTEHVIIYKGTVENAENLDVRVHSECLTSEVFESLRCDCDQQRTRCERGQHHG